MGQENRPGHLYFIAAFSSQQVPFANPNDVIRNSIDRDMQKIEGLQ